MTSDPDPAAAPDPLHETAPTTAAWTTVNISEAFPGVPTALSWTFFADALEYCFRAAFADLGMLSRAERASARCLDERCGAIFHGHPALNLDRFRAMADRSPGGSGDAVEEQMFGSIQTAGRPADNSRRRWPLIALKTPLAMATLPRGLRTVSAEADRWWRECSASPPADADTARARFGEAIERMKEAFRLQLVATMLAQGLFDQLGRLSRAAGDPALRERLATGYSSLAEIDVLTDLWEVSHERLPMSDFILRHGYHGPGEGELSSSSWREDTGELTALVEEFRRHDVNHSPRAAIGRRIAARADAERELLAATPGWRRPATRLVLRLARTFIPARETGKAAFLRIVDVARASARDLGRDAVARGVTPHPDDVFHLTATELLGPDRDQPWNLVPARQAQRARHRTVHLPDVWVGEPTVRASGPGGIDELVVTGLAVSPGVVEGTARVIVDPDRRDSLNDGEILVCHTTDPSWTPLFFLSAGIAIDVGGQLSHGAIVARELGIPCIINTRNGTTAIHDGDTVRLDGTTGTVQVISRASDPAVGVARPRRG
ncbi:MAG TPA: PEP-utilizing enzyme [Pseudonocardia sp.]|nr:PEP-utilizing enzyme [Pseudonocardia sp.]